MEIIKHRPDIRVRLPKVVYPGKGFDVEVLVDAKRSVPISRLDATLLGTETSTVGSGKNQRTYRHRTLSMSVELAGKGRLPKGRSRLPFRVDLPGELPPSYDGSHAKSEYVVRVVADIPWWPDRKSEFLVAVQLPPVALPAGEPQLYSTAPSGPRAEEAHVECSLATATVVPGHVLEGSVALYNMAFNRYRGLSLSLVARETRRDTRGKRRGSVLDAKTYTLELPIQGVTDGEAIPIRMKVPESPPASFDSRLWSLRWVLVVRAHIGWGSDAVMHIPLTMLPAGSRAAQAARALAPPTVGSERVRKIWNDVAQQLGAHFDDAALHAQRDDVTMKISRDHRGSSGIFLVAELRYPSLHLFLDGGLSSGFRRLLGGGVALGDPAWDREHYVTGRCADQVRALGASLLPHLSGQQIADLDDEHLVIERRDAGQSAAPLREITRAALAIAQAIGPARRDIPPPRGMRKAAKAWRELARRLKGKLETARMAVVGRFEGARAEVLTEWSAEGKALRTAIKLRPGFPIERTSQLRWAEGQYLEGAPRELPGEASAWLTTVQQDALALRIGRQDLELSLPAPLADTAPILEGLHRLDRLAALLRSKVGPYR